jgi:hypothetical protein
MSEKTQDRGHQGDGGRRHLRRGLRAKPPGSKPSSFRQWKSINGERETDGSFPPGSRRFGLNWTENPGKGDAAGLEGVFPAPSPSAGGSASEPGLAKGPARVVLEASELFHFKAGDILVCDVVDLSMTFVAPLAAGIVERRGGMLIHGSIIAREYGIP